MARAVADNLHVYVLTKEEALKNKKAYQRVHLKASIHRQKGKTGYYVLVKRPKGMYAADFWERYQHVFDKNYAMKRRLKA